MKTKGKVREVCSVHGFEIPEGMKPHRKTKKVLKLLAEHGSCKWERDDSPYGYLVSKQLLEIAGRIGIDCYGGGSGDLHRRSMGHPDYQPEDHVMILVAYPPQVS